MPLFKYFVFYSFENLYWVVSFFREREEDGEDDVVLDIGQVKTCNLQMEKRSKHQM